MVPPLNPYSRPDRARPAQQGRAQHPVSGTGAYVSGGVGLGAGHSRHYRRRPKKVLKDNIYGITKNSIRKIARRGGVKRIQMTIYDTVRAVIKDRLWSILSKIDAVLESTGREAERARGLPATFRKTVTTLDVIFVLNQMGDTMYGFGWYELGAKKTKKIRRGPVDDDFDL